MFVLRRCSCFITMLYCAESGWDPAEIGDLLEDRFYNKIFKVMYRKLWQLFNNNNNNSHDNVYGVVIMTKVIARVHPVHLINVDWAPGGRQPSYTKPVDLGCESAENWQLSSTSTIQWRHLGGARGVCGPPPQGLWSVKVLHYLSAQKEVCTLVIMVDNTGVTVCNVLSDDMDVLHNYLSRITITNSEK